MERTLFELLSSHPSFALAVSDLDGRVTLMTPALHDMVGLTPEDVLDQAAAGQVEIYDATGRRALDVDELPHLRAARGDVVVDQICAVRRPDGTSTYLRCNAAPVHGPDGASQGSIVLVQDVTTDWSSSLKQAELRDRLLTTVNHGLRTPMTVILGHAEMLVDALDGSVPEQLHQSVRAIARAGAELADLAATITYLGQLDQTVRVDRTAGDLAALVREVGAGCETTVSAAGLTLRTDSGAPLVHQIDPALVARAVRELVDNAAAQAPPGTQVTLQTGTWGGAAEVRVADQGPGIAAHERTRLVQPFERGSGADPSASSPGMGLALAEAIATAHGGSLVLEDNHPSGLVARLCLGRRDLLSD